MKPFRLPATRMGRQSRVASMRYAAAFTAWAFVEPLELRAMLSNFDYTNLKTSVGGWFDSAKLSYTVAGTDTNHVPFFDKPLKQITELTGGYDKWKAAVLSGINTASAAAGSASAGSGTTRGGATSDVDPPTPEQILQQSLYDALSSQGKLADRDDDGDTLVTKDDVVIVSSNLSTNSFRVRVNLTDTETSTITAPTLPGGIPVKLNGKLKFDVTATAIWKDFTFGINSGVPFVDASARTDDLQGAIKATLVRDPVTPIVSGVITGFFNVKARDTTVAADGTFNAATPANTKFVGTIVGDIQTPTMTVPTIAPATLKLSGRADIHLAISTSAAASPDTFLPLQMRFTTDSDWTFTDAPVIASPATWGGDLHLHFANVELNLGGFLNGELLPIVKDAQKFLKPIQPILSFFREEVPVLSDLSRALGNGPITYRMLARSVLGAALPDGFDNLLDTAITLSDVATDIGNISATQDQVISNAWIPMGSFDVTNPDLKTLPAYAISQTLENFTTLSTTATVPINLQNIYNWITTNVQPAGATGLGQDIVNVLTQLGQPDTIDGLTVRFPFLIDPGAGLYPLLVGRNTDLVKVTARLQNSRFDLHLPPNPLPFDIAGFDTGIDFKFDLNPDIYVQAGYDTYGLRQYLTNPSPNPVQFKLGLWVDPTSHLSLTGSADLTIPVIPGPLSLNAGAHMTGSVNMPFIQRAWQEPTKVRIFRDTVNEPNLFTGTGKLNLALGIDVEVDLLLVDLDFFIKLYSADILNIGPSIPNPFFTDDNQLATYDAATGTLRLNIGTLADRQKRGSNPDLVNRTDENVVVKPVTGINPDGTQGGRSDVRRTHQQLSWREEDRR